MMKQTIEAILISDGDKTEFGADPAWCAKRFGDTSAAETAALITMSLAYAFPNTCAPLYPFVLPAQKNDFVRHMDDVRTALHLGIKPVSTARLAARTVAFAQSRGVKINAYIVQASLNAQNAFGFVHEAIREHYMPALILKTSNTPKTCRHRWMAVAGFDMHTQSVFLSAGGEDIQLDFEQVWQPGKAGLVYFYPA